MYTHIMYTHIYVCIIYTVYTYTTFLAGKSPDIRSYTVYILYVTYTVLANPIYLWLSST